MSFFAALRMTRELSGMRSFGKPQDDPRRLLLRRPGVEKSAVGGTVGGVTAMGDLDIAPLRDDVVRRVEGEPDLTVGHLYPGVCLAFASDEAIGISGMDTYAATEGDEEVRIVLTDTARVLVHIERRGGGGGVERGVSQAVIDVMHQRFGQGERPPSIPTRSEDWLRVTRMR